MKVFVTGGAGFIGSNVVDELIRRGVTVTVFDNLSKGYEENINPKARFVKGDLNDQKILEDSMKGHDAVIHLASESIIKDSIENPEEFQKKNINYMINLLEAMHKQGIKKIVFSSSAAIYGETGDFLVKEDYRKEPLQPYGASKLANEAILSGYFHSFGINSVSLRYFNVYGPRDNQMPVTRAVPKWIKLTLLGKPVPLNWGGNQFRDYIFVGDVAKAHVEALKNCDGLRNYNIGSGKGNTMREILEMIFLALGKKSEIIDAGERPGDPHKLVADVSKIKRELGWSAQTSLEEGMKKTVEFYKENPKWLEKI